MAFGPMKHKKLKTEAPLPAKLEASADHLLSVGLDLCHWFSVAALNRTVPPDLRLPTFDRSDPLALLIGNTRAVWPPFMRHLREQLGGDAGAAEATVVQEMVALGGHPLDEWVTQQIADALLMVDCPHALSLGHVMQPSPPPLQRYAEASGFAPLGRGKLSLHPLHGPWISLRAVVVFDAPADAAPHQSSSKVAPSCAACTAPCLTTEVHAPTAEILLKMLSSERRRWIAARQACPVGQGSCFSDAQLAFHYADRGLSKEA